MIPHQRAAKAIQQQGRRSHKCQLTLKDNMKSGLMLVIGLVNAQPLREEMTGSLLITLDRKEPI